MTRFPSITAIVVTLSLLVFTEVSASPRNHRRRRLSRIDDGTSPADSVGISDVYEYCTTGQDSVQNLQCIADTLEKNATLNAEDAHTWFTIYAAALVFFMQAGFAMLCAGSVRLKNVGNTMLKNLLDACGAALGFFSVGYAFAFGGQNDSDATTFIGSSNFFMIGIVDLNFWLFQFAFAATSATIVAGTLAERSQMAAYLCYSVVLTGFVYPVVAHSVWSNNGFLSPFNVDPFLGVGVLDFSGSGVVHITGGATALFATMILGPRKGRFYDARGNPLPKPKPFPGHSVALQMLGTFILWFGWYGFNPGSALGLSNTLNTGEIAALAAVVTTLGAASAAVSALFTNLIIEERTTGEAKFDLVVAMNGALGGLVSITAGCAVYEPWAAVVVGTIAGWLFLVVSKLLIKVRIDDAVDAIPVHLANGVWGLLSVGFFASPTRLLATYGRNRHPGWFYSLHAGAFDAHLLAAQVVGILFIIGWVFFLMFPFFIWLNYMGWFRADSLEELVGLDISYHGGGGLHNDEVKQEYVEAFNRKKGRTGATTETEMPHGEEEEEYEGPPEDYVQGQPYYDDDPRGYDDYGGGYQDQGMQGGYPVQHMQGGYPHPDQGVQGGYPYPDQGYHGQPGYEQPTNDQGYEQEAAQYGQVSPHPSYRQPEPPGPAFNGNLPASFRR